MRRRQLALTAVLVLMVATEAAAWLFLPHRADASLTPIVADSCVYADLNYSLHACLFGSRCLRGSDDSYYWEDDSTCPQTSPGPRGLPQV